MSNSLIEPRATIYLHCRAFQVVEIYREENPRTRLQQYIIVILAQRPRHIWRFWFIQIAPDYTHNTVLLQRVTSNGQHLGEPHEVILDEDASLTMEIVRSRGGSM
jgi:hypothetical protein